MTHTHTCARCGIAFACGGSLEQNHDGWPDVICVAFHADGETECVGCRTTTWCVNCGQQPAIGTWCEDALCLACAPLDPAEIGL